MKGKTHTSNGKEPEAFRPVSTGVTTEKSTFGQTDQKPGLADSVDPIFRDRHFQPEAQETSGQDVQKPATAHSKGRNVGKRDFQAGARETSGQNVQKSGTPARKNKYMRNQHSQAGMPEGSWQDVQRPGETAGASTGSGPGMQEISCNDGQRLAKTVDGSEQEKEKEANQPKTTAGNFSGMANGQIHNHGRQVSRYSGIESPAEEFPTGTTGAGKDREHWQKESGNFTAGASKGFSGHGSPNRKTGNAENRNHSSSRGDFQQKQNAGSTGNGGPGGYPANRTGSCQKQGTGTTKKGASGIRKSHQSNGGKHRPPGDFPSGRTYDGQGQETGFEQGLEEDFTDKRNTSSKNAKRQKRYYTSAYKANKGESQTAGGFTKETAAEIFSSKDPDFQGKRPRVKDSRKGAEGYRKNAGESSSNHKDGGTKKEASPLNAQEGNFPGNSGQGDQAAETARSAGDTMEPSGNRKLEKKAQKAREKTERAKEKLPQKRGYHLVRQFDGETGKAHYKLQVEKRQKKPGDAGLARRAGRRAGAWLGGTIHQKISEQEKENSGVEAAHKTEQAGETVISYAGRLRRDKAVRQRRRIAALERRQFKAEANFNFEKYLDDHPQIRKKAFQKRLQKQRIKREYAKALKKGMDARQASQYAQKAAQSATAAARKLQEFARRNTGLLLACLMLVFLLFLFAASAASCGAMLASGISTILAGSYQSLPAQIDAADAAMTLRELQLQDAIDNMEADHPGYDEYEYNLGEIGHGPFTLISYLSAIYGEFTAEEADGHIGELFEEMYTLTLTEREEERTRTVTVTDPETGEAQEKEEVYTVRILDVTLTVTPLETVVAGRLNGDAAGLYDAYQETKGALQQFYSPLQLDWQSLIKSYYGYRKNPATGEKQFHRGIDIAVPEGTGVYAAQDGTVTVASYAEGYGNYIVIRDAEGYETKYAHLSALNVSTGQTATHGDLIGRTGSTGSATGSHLHLECLYGGEYYNPLFYFENGSGSIYGAAGQDPAASAYGDGTRQGLPEEASHTYPDGDVAALFAEAERYIGYPYVWGGSSPSTSFDCSGFVCWCLTQSGYYNMPRTTAQGIYDRCMKIDPPQARAGDLVFFTGTYNSAGPVSHIGIYAGNGQMIHCGNPIRYVSINTPYWQQHFYAFGRLG